MKKLASIFIMFFFFNFTVSPLFWTSSYFGKVTEERADGESSEGSTAEEESALKLFYSFNSEANGLPCKEGMYTEFSGTKVNPIFIEGPIQPPEQLL